jgi:DHA1 family tetracycline resistance protein-like MFS transporter
MPRAEEQVRASPHRAEQYRRSRPEREESLLGAEPAGSSSEFGRPRRLSDNRVELGGKGAGPNGVEPNLCAELKGLCPLFLLIFVEVAALGLPIAILPIITTTEFAQSQYGAPMELYYLHEGGECTVGSWTPATAATVQEIPGPVPEASACTATVSEDDLRRIPGAQATEPCCADDTTPPHLSYPIDSCPTGLDGFSDNLASNYYYPFLEACTNGNGYAAGAIAYSDAARNVLTFFAGGAIGAIADAKGRKTMLVIAEIVASLPNLALYLWWIIPGFSIYIYYVVRALSGLMNSVAVGIAYVADKTSEDNRAVCIGCLIAVAAIGFISAPIGVILPYSIAFATSNVMNAFTIVWTMFAIEESLPPERRDPLVWGNINPLRTMGVLVRNKLFFLLTSSVIFNSASNKGTTDISPFVLQQSFGFNSIDVGYLVVALGFVVIFLQAGLIKPLIACMGERGVIIFGIAAGIPYYLGFSLLSLDGRRWQAYGLTLLFGGLSTLVFPATSSLFSRNSGEDEQGLVQGALFGAQSLAQAVGGLLFVSLYNLPVDNGQAAIAYAAAAAFQVVALVATVCLPKDAKK